MSSPLPAEILSLYNYTIGRINNSSNRNSNGNHSSAREESDQTDESQNKTTSVTEAISIDPLQSKSVFATINDFIDSSLQSLDRFLLRSIPSIMQDQYSLMYPAFLTFDHFIVSSNNHTVMHLLRSLRSTQSTTSSSSSNATTNSNFDMDINSGIHKGNKTTSKYSIKSGSATTGVSNEVNSSNTTVLFVSEHTIVNDESGQVFESEKDESTPKNVFDHMKKNLADWWKNVLHNVQKEAKDDTDMDSITRLSGSTTSAAGNSSSSRRSKSMHENTDIETDSEFILSEKGNSDDSNDLTGTLLTRLLRTGSFNPFLLFRVMHVGYILYMLQCIHHLTYLFEFIIVVCAYVGSVLLYVLSSIW